MEKSLQALNRQEKIAVWSERIASCRSSGISVRAWCEENGISTASYYKWQKKLFCLTVQSAPQFAEVCVAPAARISTTVRMGDISVDIHSGADEETTAMLLRILQFCLTNDLPVSINLFQRQFKLRNLRHLRCSVRIFHGYRCAHLIAVLAENGASKLTEA